MIGLERQLEGQKKRTESLKRKVSRFPKQKKQAVAKAVRKLKLANHALLRIRLKSGRISTPARNVIRRLVLHHKVSTSQAGAVLCTVTNTGREEKVSARSSRRIVKEVGVGNQLRVTAEVQKAMGKCEIEI